jgi:hypothetical protein
LKRSAALFLLVPFLLAGCSQTPGAGLLPGAEPAHSKLDESGVEKIKSTKKAVLDLRSGKLTAEASGLGTKAADIEVPEGIDLTIIGPKGSFEAKTTHLKYTTSNERLANEVTYEVRADSNEAYFKLLNDGVKKHGLPGHATDKWIQAITKTPDFDEGADLGTGYATGLAVQYDTIYDGPDGTRLVGVTVTEQPTYAPAAASPLDTMGFEKDPMSQYVETITTPEEKVARLRAYTALPEVLNAASPAHPTPASAYKDLFEKDIITANYRDRFNDQTDWGTGQFPARNAGYTYQVTGIYCPMHEQTLAVLDRGFLGCSFTGTFMHDGEPVSKSTAEAVTGWNTADADHMQRAEVYMKKDAGYWKVDDIKFYG